MHRIALPSVLVLLIGCTPTLYAPTQVHTPLLREAGQFQATLALTNAQAAYALSPNVMVVAGGHLNGFESEDRTRLAGGWLGEAGAGGFGSLLHPDVRWSLLGGGGAGRSWSESPTAGATAYAASGIRGFVQPSVGWVTPYVEVLGAVRLSGVKYVDFAASGFTADEATRLGMTEANVTGPVWFFAEPAVTVKAGYRWVKLFAQQTWALKLNADPLPHEDSALTVGVSVDLAQWYGDWRF